MDKKWALFMPHPNKSQLIIMRNTILTYLFIDEVNTEE